VKLNYDYVFTKVREITWTHSIAERSIKHAPLGYSSVSVSTRILKCLVSTVP